MLPRQEWAGAHARGLPLLGAIQAAFPPKQGVRDSPAPRLQRARRQTTRCTGAHQNLMPARQEDAGAHAAALSLLGAICFAFPPM